MKREVRRGARDIPEGETDAGADAGRYGLHLSHAPRDRAGRTRRLPDLRDGARAEGRASGGRGSEPRTGRLHPPVMDWGRADGTGTPPGDGRLCRDAEDRKRVVAGKGVALRVDLRGPPII